VCVHSRIFTIIIVIIVVVIIIIIIILYYYYWSESQGYMSTKVRGDKILEEDLVPTLPPPYILPANLARVLHPS
jgi:nitrogen fixation-related uncharacterized protein